MNKDQIKILSPGVPGGTASYVSLKRCTRVMESKWSSDSSEDDEIGRSAEAT